MLEILVDSNWLVNNINYVCYFIDRNKQINGLENTYKYINDDIPDVCKSKAFEWLFTTLKENEITEIAVKCFKDYVYNIDKFPFTYFVPQHWIKICRNNSNLLLLCKKAFEFENKGYGPYNLYLIFERFNRDCLFDNLFKEDSKFIEDVYLKSLERKDVFFDENGSYLLKIIDNNINFLYDFIDVFLYKHHDSYAKKRINALWDSDNYMFYGDLLFSRLISNDKKYMIQFYATTIMGENIFDGEKSITGNQLKWFEKSLSKYCKEQDNIIYLFECIRDFNYGSKVKCIELLFKYNNDFETFKHINLNPTIILFSGSEVPYIKRRISFYEKIKEIIPPEICFIDHLSYIDEVIQELQDSIKRAVIREKKHANRLNW